MAGAAEQSIVRDLTFADFLEAIAFVDEVAEIAEAANHHPDILIHGWNKVRLTLSTDSEGGLTDADFELAGEIDRMPERGPAAPGRSTLPCYGCPARRKSDERRRRTSPKSQRRVNALKLILTAVLVAINAFFVISEYALVRSRRARLEVMREEGVRGAELALEQLANINEYISAVQIGVTMTSIGIGALGEPALAAVLKGRSADRSATAWPLAISVVVAFLIIASAQLIAGEMVPKFYAIDRAEAVARRVARPLRRVQRRLSPLHRRRDRRRRPHPAHARRRMSRERRGGSPDELKRLIAESYAGGQLDQGEAGMLTGVFHLHEQEARQVMTPIPAVVTVDTSEDVETALRLCVSSGHTRLVVTEDENRDRVRGIVHATRWPGC